MFVESSRGTRVAIIAGPVSKRGDGSVRRCALRATVCGLRRGVRRSGGVMRGRLRRPYRPLQVIGVLAAVLPIARKSLQFSRSAERAGKLPIPAQFKLAKSGERLHANAAPILRAALSASQCSTKLPRDSHRTNSSRRNQRRSTIGGSRRIPCAIGA